MRPIDIDVNIKQGPGTITNRETGAELHGEIICAALHSPAKQFYFAIDGATGRNTFFCKDWTFTPDPEPVKDGYYLRNGIIYRINGDRVTGADLNLTGDGVFHSANNARTIADQGVFLGDLEGNR